ncbi:MAG: AMP-binding protein, partial [Prevotellaceae bacterium]|nr:AMP-binding protein [Candidatus Colivivens caballi]
MQHYFQTLQQTITENWGRKALCDFHGDSFTFGGMYEQIKKLHILFSEFGVKKGDKIAICGRNQARWGISFLAVNAYEAVAVPVLADFTS